MMITIFKIRNLLSDQYLFDENGTNENNGYNGNLFTELGFDYHYLFYILLLFIYLNAN